MNLKLYSNEKVRVSTHSDELFCDINVHGTEYGLSTSFCEYGDRVIEIRKFKSEITTFSFPDKEWRDEYFSENKHYLKGVLIWRNYD